MQDNCYYQSADLHRGFSPNHIPKKNAVFAKKETPVSRCFLFIVLTDFAPQVENQGILQDMTQIPIGLHQQPNIVVLYQG